MTDLRFRLGDRVSHPQFGLGTILDSYWAKCRFPYRKVENAAVKFDNGGPQGFFDAKGRIFPGQDIHNLNDLEKVQA